MHRKHFVLIFSISLVSVISIIVASYSSSTDLQEQNTLIDNAIIESYKHVSAVKALKSGESMQLLVHYPIFGASLNAKII